MNESTRTPARPQPPLCLAARVSRVHGGKYLLGIESPGRKKGTTLITPYLLEPVPTPLGEAYTLHNLTSEGHYTNERYDVLLADGHDDAAFDGCDCKGFLAHQRCKHVLALRMLRGEGELPAPPAPAAAPAWPGRDWARMASDTI